MVTAERRASTPKYLTRHTPTDPAHPNLNPTFEDLHPKPLKTKTEILNTLIHASPEPESEIHPPNPKAPKPTPNT